MAETNLQPTIFVIFGITGDLAGRYLLPALYHLFKDQLLHEHTQVIGLTRQDMTADELFGKVELCINETDNVCDPVALQLIRSKTKLLQFDPAKASDYGELGKQLQVIEDEHGVCMNRLFYLSIPPSLFEPTMQNLGKHGLNEGCQHGTAAVRVLVEKPFGADVASAKELISQTNKIFKEEQVFRIDHYLAKETVQNILTFRHANPVFKAVWNRQHIESIKIIMSEQLGVANRAAFYDGVGALRDVVQNHLLQLLAVTTMDIPDDLFDASIHHNKQAVLEAVTPADPALAVRGQYASYRQEVQHDDSITETYARLTVAIDNDTWRGVPMTIITGKAMTDKYTDITITFKTPANQAANILTFRIQPNEGIGLALQVKRPSFEAELAEASMDFSYSQTFGSDSSHPEAYERVLVDAVKGDRTLFATSGEVLASWQIIEPLIDEWRENGDGLLSYPNDSVITGVED